MFSGVKIRSGQNDVYQLYETSKLVDLEQFLCQPELPRREIVLGDVSGIIDNDHRMEEVTEEEVEVL